jgi:hypothetical protein
MRATPNIGPKTVPTRGPDDVESWGWSGECCARVDVEGEFETDEDTSGVAAASCVADTDEDESKVGVVGEVAAVGI